MVSRYVVFYEQEFPLSNVGDFSDTSVSLPLPIFEELDSGMLIESHNIEPHKIVLDDSSPSIVFNKPQNDSSISVSSNHRLPITVSVEPQV